MSTPQNQKDEKIISTVYKEFEIIKKEKFNEFRNEYYTELEVIINGQKFTAKEQEFDDILKSISAKIAVLKYVRDPAYEKIAQEILLDFAIIIYKLNWKNRY